MVIIMDLVVKARNKNLDNILVPYGNIFQCLGGFFVTEVWDIYIIVVNKVPNKITIIVD